MLKVLVAHTRLILQVDRGVAQKLFHFLPLGRWDVLWLFLDVSIDVVGLESEWVLLWGATLHGALMLL